ncbi:MAG: choice-of-anchor D domain-containing protein [Sphingomonadales bacterium]
MRKIAKSVLLLTAATGFAGALDAQTALTTSSQSITAIPAGQTVTQLQTVNSNATTTFSGATTVSNTTTVAANSFTAFDSNAGILVGSKLAVDINYYTSLAVQGAGAGGIKVNAASDVGMSLSFNGGIISTSSNSLSVLCAGGNCQNGFNNNIVYGPVQKNNNQNVKFAGTAVAPGSLAGFTSASPSSFTFLTSVNATNTTLSSDGSKPATSMTARTEVVTSGSSFNLSYDYLNFSRPSFAAGSAQLLTAAANIGTVFRNATNNTASFTISNLANTANGGGAANTSPVKLDGAPTVNGNPVAGSGLVTSLTSLSNLQAGTTSGPYSIGIDTSTTGTKSGTVVFKMTDDPYVGGVAVTNAAGMRSTNLSYAVSGTVVDRSAASLSTSAVVTSLSKVELGNVYRNSGTQVGALIPLANIGTGANVAALVSNASGTNGFSTNLNGTATVVEGTPQSIRATLNTNGLTTGARTGVVTLSSADNIAGMAAGTVGNVSTLTLNTSATVWDRANPQFGLGAGSGTTQTISFGNVFVGQPVSRGFNVTNVGGGSFQVAAGITGVTASGSANFTNSVPVGANIAAGGFGLYLASVNATSAGARSGTVLIALSDVTPSGGINGTNNNYVLTLNTSATGVNRAAPSLSSTSINFGNVYRDAGVQSSAQTLTNTAANSAAAVLNSVTPSTGFGSTLVANINIANGSPLAFNATFDPGAAASGARTGTILLSLKDSLTGMNISATANSYNLAINTSATVWDRANPLFTGTQAAAQTVNFGTVFAGSTVTAANAFSISNVTGSATNRVATSLVSADITGANGLTTTLTSLSNLGMGSTSGPYSASYTAGAAGAATGNVKYTLTDVAPGTIAGANQTYQLTLNAQANVVNRAAPSLNGSSVQTTSNVDLGNVYRGATATSGTINVYNIATAPSVPAIVTGTANSGGFTNTLANSTQINPGSSTGFTSSFVATGASGARTGSVLISLADVTTGMAAGTTANPYTLTVNTTANVWDVSNAQFAGVTPAATRTVDFGTVFAGSTTTVSNAFALTNLADVGTNRVSASVTGVNTAAAAGLATSLTTLSSLGAGTTTGNYSASYTAGAAGTGPGNIRINVADVAPVGGITGTGASYQLTLQGQANVVNRAAPSLSASTQVATTSIDLGNVYRGATVTSGPISVYNIANAPAVAAVVTGTANAGGVTNSLLSGTQINPGSSTSFTTTFAATGASGANTGVVVVALSDVTTGMNGAVANNYNLKVNTSATVWDYSNAQFAGGSNGTTRTLDLGTVFAGSTASASYALTNLADLGTNRVSAAVTSVNSAGANGFGTDLTTLSNLSAGSTSSSYTATLNALTAGQQSGQFVINMSDVSPTGGITGSGSTYQLTLNTTAKVINHANPSFDGSTVLTTKTLDFGNVSSRGGTTSRAFSLFNIGDLNSAGLELYQVNGPNNALFSSDVSPFLNLAGGSSNSFMVTLNPVNLGVANGVYTFLLRDNAPGTPGGRNYTLTLNVLASVFDPVPEPASWMSMMLGFGLVGAMARRRKPARAA